MNILVSATDMDAAQATLEQMAAEADRRAAIAAAGGEVGDLIRVVVDGAAEVLSRRECLRPVESLARKGRKVDVFVVLRDAFAGNALGVPVISDLGCSSVLREATSAGHVQLDWVPMGEYTPLLTLESMDDAIARILDGGR